MTDASQAALTISLAAVAGIISQSLARSVNLPGIVVLLAVGVLLGPDVANVVQPDTLGAALPEVVGFAVAVILFEGGMHLELSRFGAYEKPIRRLVTLGAVVTAIAGALAARLLMGWDWRFSALFGCLVIVTGPTVVTPLLRRFKLVSSVSDVLEAEGVLIDAVGAVIAVVALEIAIEPNSESLARGATGIAIRLGLGSLLGLVVGFLVSWLLSVRNLIAEGLENVFTLAFVWGLFKVSEALVHESGIAAVTMAGLVLGSTKGRKYQKLLDFNDQLTTLLIGMLFVLLAADVRLADVRSLGWRGVATVAALILVVRPLNVLVSTAGSKLKAKQKLFIMWIGPRGIIAAAVASLFAETLEARGFTGGAQLKALVFLVIAITVVLAGLTGGPLARLLKLSRPPSGWLFLGANPLALTLAQLLKDSGQKVRLIDRSVDHCSYAREKGFRVFRGNGLDDELLSRAHVERYAGVIGITPSDETNLLFIQKTGRLGKAGARYAALRSVTLGASAADVEQAGGAVLFGDEYEVERWATRVRDGRTEVVTLVAGSQTDFRHDLEGSKLAVPLALIRDDEIRPFSGDVELRNGDRAYVLIAADQRDKAMTWLYARGWYEEDGAEEEEDGA
ncbi:MAG: cation:proton antiporter [Myxococcota bacterium]